MWCVYSKNKITVFLGGFFAEEGGFSNVIGLKSLSPIWQHWKNEAAVTQVNGVRYESIVKSQTIVGLAHHFLGFILLFFLVGV